MFMKNAFLVMIMLVSSKSYGQMLPKAPAPLTDSKIERTLDSGKKQEFDGNEWMIVKRGPKKPKPAPVAAPKCEPLTVVETVYVTQQSKLRRNRVSLEAGQGPNPGVDTSTSGVTAEARTKVGAVGAAQYQRLLTERISIGGQVQSNKTTLIELGFDF